MYQKSFVGIVGIFVGLNEFTGFSKHHQSSANIKEEMLMNVNKHLSGVLLKGQPTSNIFILPLKRCFKITKNALNQNIQIFIFLKLSTIYECRVYLARLVFSPFLMVVIL